MNSNKTKAALLALLLFGLGVLVGVLGQRYYASSAVNSNAPLTAQEYRQKYISEMQSKLKLSQEQVNQLQVILDDTKAKVKAMRDSHHDEMVRIKDEQLTKVKGILSADQATKYEALVAEHEQHAKEQDEKERRADAAQRDAHLKALGR